MVVKVPDVAPLRTNKLSSSIDLGPTLLDLCQVAAFDGMQGHSLAPLLEDAGASVREYVLIEDDVAAITAKLTPIPGKTRTIVTEDARYTRNSKGEEQLFNLAEDYDEMTDLKNRDAVLRGTMVDRLTDALIEADDVARGAPATHHTVL